VPSLLGNDQTGKKTLGRRNSQHKSLDFPIGAPPRSERWSLIYEKCAHPARLEGGTHRFHRQQGLGFDPQRVLWYVAGHSKGPIEASLPDLCIAWWREGYLSRANRAFIDFLLEQNPI